MPKINIPGFFLRLLVFWAIAIAAAFGLFQFSRDFTTCWRLTSLPGVASANCAGPAVKPLKTPVIGADTPTPEATSTPEFFFSEDIEYPTWDGASRINVLFVGLRG